MATGIRATVEFSTSAPCPMQQRAAAADATIDSAASSVRPPDGPPPVTDYAVTGDLEVDSALSALFAAGTAKRYRFARAETNGAGCPCECLGGFGIPVTRYVVEDGVLTLVFYAADYDELKAVIGELRERYPEVNIKRFVRSPTGDQPQDSVFVDRSQLTARQLEVLRTALDMGYFERPRGANASEVAEALDINPSTFSEHLAVAQRKLLADVLERGH